MTFQQYLNWINQRQARENLSLICLREKHKDISREVSRMLGGRNSGD